MSIIYNTKLKLFSDFLNEREYSPEYLKKIAKDLPRNISTIISTDNNKNSKKYKNVISKAKEIYDKLIETLRDKKTYDKSIEFIEKVVNDSKLKFILSLGFNDDVYGDDELEIEDDVLIPVSKLIPTQNFIGVESSLKYSIAKKPNPSLFANGSKGKVGCLINTPIVVYNGKYIVDGHHRWSQMLVTNPDVMAHCINIKGNISPITLLKTVQMAIAVDLGNIPSSKGKGTDLFSASDDMIRDYIKKTICDEAIKFYSKKLNLSGDNVIDDIADYFINNCHFLQKHNKPIANAPDRKYMPQFGKDADALEKTIPKNNGLVPSIE